MNDPIADIADRCEYGRDVVVAETGRKASNLAKRQYQLSPYIELHRCGRPWHSARRFLTEVKMKLNFQQRATANFQISRELMATEIGAMAAALSANGNLGGSVTLNRSIAIFEEESRKTLARTLEELAKLIEHRGAKWRKAIAEIKVALDEHVANAPAVLEKPLQWSRSAPESAAARAVDGQIRKVAERLCAQLAEFAEGWTAPKGMPWKERHPYLDRILFMLIGAAITVAGAFLEKAF